MSEHPSDDVLATWTRHQLRGAELLRVDDHVAACAACRERAGASPARAARAWEASLRGEHLSYPRLESYVDGALGDEERASVDAHAAQCRMCADELSDLRLFRGGTRRRPAAAGWGWAAAAALALIAIAMLLRRPASPTPTIVVEAPRPRAIPARPVLRDAKTTFPLGASGDVETLPPRAAETLRQLRAGVLTSAAILADVRGSSDVLRDTDPRKAELRIVQPLGVVLDDRPRFAWEDADADKPRGGTYTVEIFDPSYRLVARSGKLTSLAWQPEKPLPRGQTLDWQVQRQRDGESTTAPAPPAPPARFRVVSSAGLDDILAARAAGSHLLAALAYEREGMISEARRELDALAALNPRSSLVAQMRKTLGRADVHQRVPIRTNGDQ